MNTIQFPPGVESPLANVSTRWPLVAAKTVKLHFTSLYGDQQLDRSRFAPKLQMAKHEQNATHYINLE